MKTVECEIYSIICGSLCGMWDVAKPNKKPLIVIYRRREKDHIQIDNHFDFSLSTSVLANSSGSSLFIRELIGEIDAIET